MVFDSFCSIVSKLGTVCAYKPLSEMVTPYVAEIFSYAKKSDRNINRSTIKAWLSVLSTILIKSRQCIFAILLLSPLGKSGLPCTGRVFYIQRKVTNPTICMYIHACMHSIDGVLNLCASVKVPRNSENVTSSC